MSGRAFEYADYHRTVIGFHGRFNGCGRGAGFMTKRTSKSASATRKTSSRSGTSAPTDGTASKRPRKAEEMGKFGFVVEQIRAMSSEEFLQSLIRAGIVDKDGKLTAKYKARKR